MYPFWASVYVADETHPFSLRDANPGKPATTLFQELQLARNHTSLFVPPFAINDDQTGEDDEDYAGEKVVKRGFRKKQPSKREGDRNAKIFKRGERAGISHTIGSYQTHDTHTAKDAHQQEKPSIIPRLKRHRRLKNIETGKGEKTGTDLLCELD